MAVLWWCAAGLAGIGGFVAATVRADMLAGRSVNPPWWAWLAAGAGALCIAVGVVDFWTGLFSR